MLFIVSTISLRVEVLHRGNGGLSCLGSIVVSLLIVIVSTNQDQANHQSCDGECHEYPRPVSIG
ncbi:MAG: hypothetical protein R5N74_02580, partial [Cutibacterium granulosum]|nr:hypothetical protein [Cutibacterium granulosum]